MELKKFKSLGIVAVTIILTLAAIMLVYPTFNFKNARWSQNKVQSSDLTQVDTTATDSTSTQDSTSCMDSVTAKDSMTASYKATAVQKTPARTYKKVETYTPIQFCEVSCALPGSAILSGNREEVMHLRLNGAREWVPSVCHNTDLFINACRNEFVEYGTPSVVYKATSAPQAFRTGSGYQIRYDFVDSYCQKGCLKFDIEGGRIVGYRIEYPGTHIHRYVNCIRRP